MATQAIDTANLAQSIATVLLDRSMTIAVAESATAGAVQAALGQISGASDWFRGGMVAYHLDTKVDLLGVDRGQAERDACVSTRVAAQMADGARSVFGADIGLATTGWIEPDGSVDVAAPHLAWALAAGVDGHLESTSGWIEVHDGDRTDTQAEFVRAVLTNAAEALGAP